MRWTTPSRPGIPWVSPKGQIVSALEVEPVFRPNPKTPATYAAISKANLKAERLATRSPWWGLGWRQSIRSPGGGSSPFSGRPGQSRPG